MWASGFQLVGLAAQRALSSRRSTRASKPFEKRDSRITPLVTIGLDADVGHHGVRYISPIAFSQRGSQSTHTHAAAMCGYCGASARIKFDDEQFAALFNELQARGDKTKLSNRLVSERPSIIGTRNLLHCSRRVIRHPAHIAQRS